MGRARGQRGVIPTRCARTGNTRSGSIVDLAQRCDTAGLVLDKLAAAQDLEAAGSPTNGDSRRS